MKEIGRASKAKHLRMYNEFLQFITPTTPDNTFQEQRFQAYATSLSARISEVVGLLTVAVMVGSFPLVWLAFQSDPALRLRVFVCEAVLICGGVLVWLLLRIPRLRNWGALPFLFVWVGVEVIYGAALVFLGGHQSALSFMAHSCTYYTACFLLPPTKRLFWTCALPGTNIIGMQSMALQFTTPLNTPLPLHLLWIVFCGISSWFIGHILYLLVRKNYFQQEALRSFSGKLQEKVALQTQQLRALNHRLARLQEEERKYLARELHDILGQNLTSIRHLLFLLRSDDTMPEPSRKRAQVIDQIVHSTHEVVRNMLHKLRPPLLERQGLAETLTQYCATMETTLGVHIDLQIESNPLCVDYDRALVLFRTVQESLTNVRRHAHGATTVSIVLRQDPSGLTLLIRDDGPGLPDEPSFTSGIGCLGMHERALMLQGECTLRNRTDQQQGAEVFLYLPLHPKALSSQPTQSNSSQVH